MRFASLGSGSAGNALLVEGGKGADATTILVDCGFGPREIDRRSAALVGGGTRIDALVVTHEHGDHVGGAFRFAAAHEVPLYLTHGTWLAARSVPYADRVGPLLRFIDPFTRFVVRGVEIEPVAVPHDAREPVQFIVDDGDARLAVLTDLGHVSARVRAACVRLDALLLECNHDPRMLERNPRYPPSLKQRVGGPWGHLSNAAAAELLATIDQARLRRVVAGHLSRENNAPDLARRALAGALGSAPEDILIADQDLGLSWIDVGCRETI